MGHELKTERELSLDFLRVCEAAAIAAARTMGQGDRKYSDQVAVEAMREVMDTVPMRGRIVIGEGERDEAPMLYIGEELGRDVDDLTVITLDRSRHKKLINDVREAGARIRLISDGDLSAGISAAVAGTNIHALMGIGGAPEGVITAAAMKCLNGEIQARLVFDPERLGVDKDKVPPEKEVIERLKSMGITDPNKVYDTDDLAPGKKIIFAATGVTDGALMRGVRFFGAGKRTHSVVMTKDSKSIRFVDTVHVEGGPDAVIR